MYWLISAFLQHATGETGPNPRMGRQGTGKGNPGKQLQRKKPPTLSKRWRKVKLLWNLPAQRASRLWRNGVPPFHATQDNDTLPLSPHKVHSQSSTSLSLHSIKICRDKSPAVVFSYVAGGGTKSRTDVHFLHAGTTAGMPLA